jgi:hypothetical protein
VLWHIPIIFLDLSPEFPLQPLDLIKYPQPVKLSVSLRIETINNTILRIKISYIAPEFFTFRNQTAGHEIAFVIMLEKDIEICVFISFIFSLSICRADRTFFWQVPE